MAAWITLALAGLSLLGGEEGRMVQLYGRGFTFQILEPAGWVLDTSSAPQIANFILYPEGSDWRRAEALVTARFWPRDDEEDRASLLERSKEEFLRECPFADEVVGVKTPSLEPFAVQVYHCPGVRRELVATAEFPNYFVAITLSASDEATSERHRSVFERIVSSFRWSESSLQGPERPSRPSGVPPTRPH